MPHGKKRIILFDLYQTLIDVDIDEGHKKTNEAKGWKVFARSLERYGARIASAEFLALVEKYRADFYVGKNKDIHYHDLCELVTRVLREDLKIDIAEAETISLLYEYRKIARGYVRLYSGVAETLAELAIQYTLAVASYTQGCYTQPELRELGIEKFFSHFLYTSDIGYRKTSPEFYKRCLEIVGKKAEDCVMIGDNYDADVLMPRQLGMKAILIKNPATAGQRDRLLDRETTIDLSELRTLPELVSRTFLSKSY